MFGFSSEVPEGILTR